MSKFITPVSIQVTQEQYEKDLKEPLKELGYITFDKSSYSSSPVIVLATNYERKHNQVAFTYKNYNDTYNRYFIDHYNPSLFLSLAAQSDEKNGIAGEYWKCKVSFQNLFTKDKLYKANHSINKIEAFISNNGELDGFVGDNHSHFIKATKEELIEFFIKKETVMTNVDRSTSIKCANEEEFNTVVQWLKDNGEEVFYNCVYSNGSYPSIVAMNSGTWTSDILQDNSKTPQELGIIKTKTKKVKQTIKKSDLILLHNSYNCATWTSEILALIQKHPFAFDETLIEIPDELISKAINEANPVQQSSIKKMGIDLVVDKSVNLRDNYIFQNGECYSSNGKQVFLNKKFNWKLDGNVLTAETK